MKRNKTKEKKRNKKKTINVSNEITAAKKRVVVVLNANLKVIGG